MCVYVCVCVCVCLGAYLVKPQRGWPSFVLRQASELFYIDMESYRKCYVCATTYIF